MSLQDEFRQALPSEEELIATQQQIVKEGVIGTVPQECPTRAQLMSFVAGSCTQGQVAAVSEHFAECNSCTAVLADIRSHQKITERRIFSRNRLVFAAVAVAVFVAALLATWLLRSQFPSETVIADLRNITRGIDTSSDSGVVLHGNTRRLRILLAPHAAEGHYEIAVFNPGDRTVPVLMRAASSTRGGDSLMIEVPIVVSSVQPGPYLLGIMHEGSEWAFYTIRID